jgi:hypothetical protein
MTIAISRPINLRYVAQNYIYLKALTSKNLLICLDNPHQVTNTQRKSTQIRLYHMAVFSNVCIVNLKATN